MTPTNPGRGVGEIVGAITTASGRIFDPMADEPAFDIEDIAHALGMCVRYNGHVSRFYSVAEHCVLVSKIMAHEATNCGASSKTINNRAIEGLFHDALEAYLSDVPAPFKQFLPDYREFDTMLETKLRTHFGIPPHKTPECKRADWIALFLESDVLMPRHGADYTDPQKLREEALRTYGAYGVRTGKDHFRINCWSPEKAGYEFLYRYRQLTRWK